MLRLPRARARRGTNEKMPDRVGSGGVSGMSGMSGRVVPGMSGEVGDAGDVGSGGFGAGRGGVDKPSGSWRERVAVPEAEAATPVHWASIEGRRKRQRVRKSRRPKQARRTLEERVADVDDGKSADAREQPGYGLRDGGWRDVWYEYDTIFGDPVVANRQEPCASPPVKKLDFGAVAQHLPASSPREPSTPAPVSVLKAAAETPAPPPVVRQQARDALTRNAALPTQKLDFEAIELEAAAANPVEPLVPASVSVPHCPWIPHRRR